MGALPLFSFSQHTALMPSVTGHEYISNTQIHISSIYDIACKHIEHARRYEMP